MSKLHEARIECQKQAAIDDARFSAVLAKNEQQRHIAKVAFNDEKIKVGLRKTSIDEYRHWLNGYLENGGKVTHYYGYPFGRQTFYTALSSGSLTPQYGSSSFCVLAPASVEITSGGHNNVFHVDGFTASGYFVPMFSDI